ncbi:hypothetical protein [Gluconacetobacter takamatsuzukensis]|uniref:DUF4168 domain-containing protein n=1 Tax=Gluconacetobacter takamatsuzukensis TaxID=1286190 RepID=A0A7W4PS98_9PROT|nr:hypothetical protein [Gluconacetobacter takamatsuzukensis]MBB2206199.1 hypothetical protein [Gluconacetobacter takamatsuzukensis]
MTTRLTILAAALAAALPAAAMAQQPQQAGQQPAQQARQPSPAEIAAFQRDVQTAVQYPLPADFLPRMTATIHALQAAGINPPNAQNLSLAQTIDQTAAVPGLSQVLSAHGFTARDFVLGISAFGITESMIRQPPPAGAHAPTPNPANVALLRAHQQEAEALLQAMN